MTTVRTAAPNLRRSPLLRSIMRERSFPGRSAATRDARGCPPPGGSPGGAPPAAACAGPTWGLVGDSWGTRGAERPVDANAGRIEQPGQDERREPLRHEPRRVETLLQVDPRRSPCPRLVHAGGPSGRPGSLSSGTGVGRAARGPSIRSCSRSRNCWHMSRTSRVRRSMISLCLASCRVCSAKGCPPNSPRRDTSPSPRMGHLSPRSALPKSGHVVDESRAALG